MKICPNQDCPGRGENTEPVEYVDTVEICADCETLLVAPTAPQPGETQQEVLPCEVTRYFSSPEAHLAADRLKAEGIAALVDDRSFSVLPVLSSNRPQVRLIVAEQDLERSRSCLALDHRAELAGTPEAGLPPAADDRCPRCGGEDLVLRRFSYMLRRNRIVMAANATILAAFVTFGLVFGLLLSPDSRPFIFLLGFAVLLYVINVARGAILECRRCGHRWRRGKNAF